MCSSPIIPKIDGFDDCPPKSIFPSNYTCDSNLVNCLPSGAPIHFTINGVQLPTFKSAPYSIITQISDDIWSRILSFLTIPEIIINFKSTCLYFKEIVMTCIVTFQITSRSIYHLDLDHFPNLQVLQISQFNPAAFKLLRNSLRKYSNLRKLIIEFSSISQKAAGIIIGELEWLKYLIELRIDCCSLSRASFSVLVGFLHKLPSLECISFSDDGLLPDCANQLMEVIPFCKKLRLIDLDCNQLGDEGLREIAAKIAYCELLECLSISSNEIGNRGCIALFKILPKLTKLHFLDISDNNIDQISISIINPVLSVCPQLQYLNISGNLFVKGSHISPDFHDPSRNGFLEENHLSPSIHSFQIKIHQTPRVLILDDALNYQANVSSTNISEKDLLKISGDEVYNEGKDETHKNGYISTIQDSSHATNPHQQATIDLSQLPDLEELGPPHQSLRDGGLHSISENESNITDDSVEGPGHNKYNSLGADFDSSENSGQEGQHLSKEGPKSMPNNHSRLARKRHSDFSPRKENAQMKVTIVSDEDSDFRGSSIDQDDPGDEDYSDDVQIVGTNYPTKKMKYTSTYGQYPTSHTYSNNNEGTSRDLYTQMSSEVASNLANLVLSRNRVPTTRAQAATNSPDELLALNSDLSLEEEELADEEEFTDSREESSDEEEESDSESDVVSGEDEDDSTQVQQEMNRSAKIQHESSEQGLYHYHKKQEDEEEMNLEAEESEKKN